MNKNFLRRWATPLTVGIFLLMSITGILMFFEVRLGLIKLAHEWLSWIMVFAVILHVILNWRSLKNYFAQKSALSIIGLFVVITVASMLIPNDGRPKGRGGPQMQAAKVLLNAPLSNLAGITNKSLEELQSHLKQQGLKIDDMDTSLEEIALENHQNPMEVLSGVLK